MLSNVLYMGECVGYCYHIANSGQICPSRQLHSNFIKACPGFFVIPYSLTRCVVS